ncbi:MAG: Asparagine synthetase [glutamine-hydrolyzing] 1 [Phycisphaerae bacterium]|nr:Asparagine synthetase [glutamine-hydrolyzing] 1 [Phycisphaerae bacterium]
MCGFAGIVSLGASPSPAIDEATLRRMAAPIVHRGPDGSGLYLSPDRRIGLIHHRLAIVDIPGGAQPMANEDGTVRVVFNGEIYNHVEIRKDLAKLGHRFATDHSDTEVIVHAYEEFGPDFLPLLRGQFAFALVDAGKGRLLLARDRLGQKPLYWARRDDGAIAFGSSVRCIEDRGELNRASLADYLRYGYVPPAGGIWSRAAQVAPGGAFEFVADPAGDRSINYWRPPATEVRRPPLDNAVAAVRAALVEATALRLRADVEVGCFLSGGIDSAIVAAIVRRELGRPLHTFTVGTEDPAYDEREPARRVAKELGTVHSEMVADPARLTAALDDLVETVGEPFADSSIIPTWFVSATTRPQVKVALSGDGGDEAFGGYARYQAARLHGRLGWSRPLWAATWPIWRLLGGARQRNQWTRLRRLADGLRRPLARAYREWVGLFSERQMRRLLRPAWYTPPPVAPGGIEVIGGGVREAFSIEGFMQYRETPVAGQPGVTRLARWPDPVAAAIGADYRGYLPGDILTKVDRASMRVGLEVRSPFLDHRVVELALSLPAEWKLHQGVGKWILRQAFGDIVPAHVWEQPKRGFSLPLDRWFREGDGGGQLVPLLRESIAFLPEDAFNRRFIDRLLARHQSGREEHSQRLWALLWLGRWWKRFV